MAIHLLCGFRKDAVMKFCSGIQNFPIIFTVPTPSLVQASKAAQRAASWSNSDFTCLNSVGCHRTGPLSAQETESHLPTCAKRIETF